MAYLSGTVGLPLSYLFDTVAYLSGTVGLPEWSHD